LHNVESNINLKGIILLIANPAENVTALLFGYTRASKVLSGISFIIKFSDEPVGIAGVIPTILSFCLANSTIVSPKTS